MPWSCDACGVTSLDDFARCSGCGEVRAKHESTAMRIGDEILGRYRLTAKLGEGAMGVVYRAEQRMGTATRPVAVKVLLSSHLRDPSVRARFMRECEVVVRLEHANTIKFFDFGELADGSLGIVMEYVDGETLADHLARGPLSLDRVLRIVAQISGSLHEAHSRGVVHRDLKPENVVLGNVAGDRDVVKVLDFGIASYRPATTAAHRRIVLEFARRLMGSHGLDSQYGFRSSRPMAPTAAMPSFTPGALAAPPSVSPPTPVRSPTRSNPTLIAVAVGVGILLSGAAATAVYLALLDESSPPAPPALPPVASWTPPLASTDAMLAADSFRRIERPDEIVSPPNPPMGPALGAGPATPAASGVAPPPHWLIMVHHEDRVTDASAALGPPDRSFAQVATGGLLALELPAGVLIGTDGGPAPDLYVMVDAASGPYRVEAAESHQRFRSVAPQVTGTVTLDLDQFELATIRYIRLSNRSAMPVLVDAVGVYRTTTTTHHH